ncbi:MAG: glycosyltransferase family 2 protein [Bacillota bacterium]|nr:glycosyltransferase family 2 protein [Bacillota bacterium]
MNTDLKRGAATFVIAHWRSDNLESKRHLEEAVEGIFNQSDTNWNIVIVDDMSPCIEARRYLEALKKRSPKKINVILKETNDGPGICRNIGIRWAYDNGSPFILFNDADDISHPKRLETVRELFSNHKDAAVVYSTFQVIDENSKPVEEQHLTQSILEILEGHRENPVEGDDAWIKIGIEKGYTNLTSSTAVKTDVAYNYPFPKEKVSEDQHAWLRYSAGGGSYIYAPDIPSLYRIPQGKPTVSRARIRGYYSQKALVDTAGFLEAMRIAMERGKIKKEEEDDLMIRFYIKLGETLGREQQIELAAEQVRKAMVISKSKTEEILALKNLESLVWVK